MASGNAVQTLCFLSNLTSAEWAAWVQAGGSIAAIFGAAGIAIHQAKLQHRNALELHKTELRSAKVDLGRTLSVLAANAAKAMKYISGQLSDREAVYKVGEGLAPCDLGEIKRIDGYLAGLPLHTLPHSTVTHSMILGATVRQFKEKVEMALRLHRQMDAAMFTDFFETLGAMNSSVQATCRDIEMEVGRLEGR